MPGTRLELVTRGFSVFMLSEYRHGSGALNTNWQTIFGHQVTLLLPEQFDYPQVFVIESLLVIADLVTVQLRIAGFTYPDQPVRISSDISSRFAFPLRFSGDQALEAKILAGSATYRLVGRVQTDSAIEQAASGVEVYTP